MSGFLCTINKPVLSFEGEGAASTSGAASLVRTLTVKKKSPYETIAGWTRLTTGLPTSSVYHGAFFNGLFFVSGTSSTTTYATSPDGRTWTNRTTPSVMYCERMAASPTALIAPCGGYGYFLRTTDGVNWTQPACSANYSNLSVCYGNGVFVATCSSGGVSSNKFYYSVNDGVTWQLSTTTLPAADDWTRPTWNGRVFCTIRNSTGDAWTSTDGSVWAKGGNLGTVNFRGTASNTDGRIVTVNAGTGVVYYSDNDGATWTTGPTLALPCNRLEYVNGWFFALPSYASTNIYVSAEGVLWRTITFTSTGGRNVSLYGNNRFFVIDNGPTEIMLSKDTFFRAPDDTSLVGSSFSYTE